MAKEFQVQNADEFEQMITSKDFRISEALVSTILKKIKSTAKFDVSNGFSAKGSFDINLTDFNIEPPSLMFIEIDNTIKIEYLIRNN